MINIKIYLVIIKFIFIFAINIKLFIMKITKHILVALFILLIYFLITTYIKPDNLFFMISVFLIVGFFILNLIIRKSLSFENYFTSNYNLLTSKFNHKKSFEISKGLMFEKVIEVINNSNFRIVDTNKEKFKILAVSSITFKSWGENLYIDFESIGDVTIMNFCSTTLFQVYSWGKNEKNYENLLSEIDNSLII